MFPSFFGSFSFVSLLETAQVIQQDFTSNVIYTGAKYDLGITDFSPISLFRAMPLALITVFYRPFLWEAANPIMIMNGIESLFFMFLTFNIFRKKNRAITLPQNKSSIQKEFIAFGLMFALFLGFFVGITSGIFGVLARLKAPVLPFFLLFIFSRIQSLQSDNKPDPSKN